MKFLLVYTTVGNRKDAEQLATIIVRKRLAACANFFKIGSRYWWKGKLTPDAEYAIIFKTPVRNYPRLEHELRLRHPYELPAIIALSIKHGSKEYLAWIATEATPRGKKIAPQSPFTPLDIQELSNGARRAQREKAKR
jgi:periplasmic divalent cation tolerance protein